VQTKSSLHSHSPRPSASSIHCTARGVLLLCQLYPHKPAPARLDAFELTNNMASSQDECQQALERIEQSILGIKTCIIGSRLGYHAKSIYERRFMNCTMTRDSSATSRNSSQHLFHPTNQPPRISLTMQVVITDKLLWRTMR
jgi:hypothetical protein